MNVAVFSAKRYDRDFLHAANASAGHRITYFDVPLERETVALAADYDAVCIFVNDKADADVLEASRAGERASSPCAAPVSITSIFRRQRSSGSRSCA